MQRKYAFWLSQNGGDPSLPTKNVIKYKEQINERS